MNILVIGDQQHFAECQHKFGHQHQYALAAEHREAEKFVASHDLVIDFILEEEPHEFDVYARHAATALINTSKISLGALARLADNRFKSKIFGFNGLPTMLSRTLLEVSVWKAEDDAALQHLLQTLQVDYRRVDDRVGMVTPRMVCMIINEAYYTVQEGTATREDIDMAMKLGTNYPYGPFEWCQRIGVRHVYELLEAVYEDTHDERYKICSLLKQEYLRS